MQKIGSRQVNQYLRGYSRIVVGCVDTPVGTQDDRCDGRLSGAIRNHIGSSPALPFSSRHPRICFSPTRHTSTRRSVEGVLPKLLVISTALRTSSLTLSNSLSSCHSTRLCVSLQVRERVHKNRCCGPNSWCNGPVGVRLYRTIFSWSQIKTC